MQPSFIFKICELKPKLEDHSKNLFEHVLTSGKKERNPPKQHLKRNKGDTYDILLFFVVVS